MSRTDSTMPLTFEATQRYCDALGVPFDAANAERAEQDDRAWFARHPKRRHRVRPALAGEGPGIFARAPDGRPVYVIVRKLSMAATRTMTPGPVETDVEFGLAKVAASDGTDVTSVFLLTETELARVFDDLQARCPATPRIPTARKVEREGPVAGVLHVML